MGRQQNSRTLENVAVIVDIDQKVSFDLLRLDPGMEDLDQVSNFQVRGRIQVDLVTESMQFHGAGCGFKPWPCGPMPNPAQAERWPDGHRRHERPR